MQEGRKELLEQLTLSGRVGQCVSISLIFTGRDGLFFNCVFENLYVSFFFGFFDVRTWQEGSECCGNIWVFASLELYGSCGRGEWVFLVFFGGVVYFFFLKFRELFGSQVFSSNLGWLSCLCFKKFGQMFLIIEKQREVLKFEVNLVVCVFKGVVQSCIQVWGLDKFGLF